MSDDDGRPSLRPPGYSYYATLVPFPIACFILAFLTDLAYWHTASVIWETMSVWLLTIGLVVAGLAVLAGLFDIIRSRRIRGLGVPWLSVVGHLVAFGLSIVNVLVHSRDGYTAIVPQGLILSALVVLVLFLSTFFGRSMAYRARVGGLA